MRSIRRLKAVTASLSVMLLLSAVVASSAAAAEAKWSYSGQVQVAGNVTLNLNGGTPIECANIKMTAETSGTYLITNPFSAPEVSCAGSPFPLRFAGLAELNAGSYTHHNRIPGTVGSSPYGTYTLSAWKAPVINGSATGPTQMVFNNTEIGRRQSDNLPITLTGTMTVTKLSNGGLVTLK